MLLPRLLCRTFGFICSCDHCKNNVSDFGRLQWRSCSSCVAAHPLRGCIEQGLFPETLASLSVQRLMRIQFSWLKEPQMERFRGSVSTTSFPVQLEKSCPFCRTADCKELMFHTLAAPEYRCIACQEVAGTWNDRQLEPLLASKLRQHRVQLERSELRNSPAAVSADMDIAQMWWTFYFTHGSVCVRRLKMLLQHTQVTKIDNCVFICVSQILARSLTAYLPSSRIIAWLHGSIQLLFLHRSFASSTPILLSPSTVIWSSWSC